jgi:hypothetical protein
VHGDRLPELGIDCVGSRLEWQYVDKSDRWATTVRRGRWSCGVLLAVLLEDSGDSSCVDICLAKRCYHPGTWNRTRHGIDMD